MYHKYIDLILTFLGLLLFTNVFGTPEASDVGSSVEHNHGVLESSLYKTHGHCFFV